MTFTRKAYVKRDTHGLWKVIDVAKGYAVMTGLREQVTAERWAESMGYELTSRPGEQR